MRNYYILTRHAKPYNYYNSIGAVVGAYILAKLVGHYGFQTEYHIRKHPNPFIPKTIYRVRRQHYVFWEISRLARGLPKTFTYSTWDAKAVSLKEWLILDCRE